MNLLYNLTRNRLNQDYINKLSQLLYDCKSIKNYSQKRINLDKAVYKYDKNNQLYITLPDFNYKSKSVNYDNSLNNKNSSIHNYTENGSNYLTNDTNYNISYNNQNNLKNEDNKKIKLNLNDIYGEREKELLDKNIKKLLLNEDMEMPQKTKKLIFNQLKAKYNFEGSKNTKRYISQPKLFQIRYDSEADTNKINKKIKLNSPKLIFPDINNNKNKFIDYLDILKTKTNELNSIKNTHIKNYLSPIFFLGNNRKNYMKTIKYKSYRKFSNEKKINNFENISKENHKFLNIMGKDIHTLKEINNENKDIIYSKNS